jgi:hypothetical protein
MPKTHRGLVISDNFIAVKMIVVIFLYFHDIDKAHQTLSIDDLFTSFFNVCVSHISPMLKGIDYLLNVYVNNLHKPKPPSVDADEDQCSTIIVLFFLWFLYLLEFFLMLNLSALGVVFSCRFLI